MKTEGHEVGGGEQPYNAVYRPWDAYRNGTQARSVKKHDVQVVCSAVRAIQFSGARKVNVWPRTLP